MKKLVMVLVAGLLVTALAVPALAWEFSMTGDWEYKYAYITRTGQNDLFGHAGRAQNNPLFTGANSTTLGLAGPFNTAVVPEGFSSRGNDAAYTVQRVRFFPEIRLNPALRWRGELFVGSQTPHYWEWFDSDGFSVRGHRGLVAPTFRRSWATAQLPWGILAAGRRPGPFGTGWSSLATSDVHSDSVLVVAPYGPLALIIGHYFADNGEDEHPGAVLNATDKNLLRAWNSAYAVTYNSGDISLGTLSRIVTYSNARGSALTSGANGNLQVGLSDGANGPASVPNLVGGINDFAAPGQSWFTYTEMNQFLTAGQIAAIEAALGLVPGTIALLNNTPGGQYLPSGPFAQQRAVTGDNGLIMQVSYLKYNNGRFFFNGEYTFQYGDSRRNGGRPLSGWTQAWHLELGTVVGPAKVSLAHFYSSGHDRRGGAYGVGAIGADPFYGGLTQTYDEFTHFVSFGDRTQAIDPYQYLIGLYGSGNNSYGAEGNCQFNDFLAYAGRLDYAVAANLNIYGTLMYAERASNTGTPIAFYGGNSGLSGGTGVFETILGIPSLASLQPYTDTDGELGTGGTVVPNVPTTYLGWELGAGFDWKLLEGMTMKGLFSYWQPGDWFKWAYVDHSPDSNGAVWQTTITDPINGAVNYQINVGRTIDPIMAFTGSMVVEF